MANKRRNEMKKRPVLGIVSKGVIASAIFASSFASTGVPFSSPPVAEAAAPAYTVNASSLNVRSGPGTQYARIGGLPRGSSINVIEKVSNGWYKINYNGKTGYVAGQYVAVNGTSVKSTYRVTATALNVRTGPSTKYARIGLLKNGAAVNVVKKESNGWYKINYNGKTAYVSGQYVSVNGVKSTYRVIATALNVRTGPSTKYARIGLLKNGATVNVVKKESNGWYRITYNGRTAYVAGQYVAAGTATILNVPLIAQRPVLPAGCEVTALAMALNYHGVNVSKTTLADKMPYDKTPLTRNSNGSIKTWGDPDVGYVGTPYGNGHTINPGPLKKLLDQYRPGGVNLHGKDFSQVEAHVKNGAPVLVWFTINHEMPNKRTWKTPAGKTISAPTPLHCIVVTGVDGKYVYFNDSEAVKKNIKMEKSKFIKIYNAMGKRALAVK
ncbi:SH3 domain-containing protein [Bacillus sp. FJAT-18017]|uniref:SH3 domain-containing protein n=1 Tax=Bacillus sp. FJAT-18017 TaxID=1705566 RepID=UPI000A854258|nr:SH3 domain-containing protein [Bacillus sp. FJAT-18017]